jgi:hypothetical protein
MDAQRERHQVGVGDAPADRGRTGRRLPRCRVVTGHRVPHRDREQQVAVLGALLLVLDQAVGAGEPTACLRELTPVDQVEGHPERAARRPPRVAALGMALLRAPQRPQAVLDVAEEVRGGRQQLQILPGQRGRPVGRRQRGVGVRPRQPPGGLAAAGKLTVPGHPLSPPASACSAPR